MQNPAITIGPASQSGRLCNNANQLAKVANTYGEASQQSVEEMTAIARQVWKEVKENW